MSRTNLDPIMTFPDGSHLLISTACSKEGSFSCALYTATIAYSYAQRLYPHSAETMKKPPYLIWPGPGPTGNADV
jgi:hypothetical protein